MAGRELCSGPRGSQKALGCVILSNPCLLQQTEAQRGSESENDKAKSSSGLLTEKGNVRAVNHPRKGEKSPVTSLGALQRVSL